MNDESITKDGWRTGEPPKPGRYWVTRQWGGWLRTTEIASWAVGNWHNNSVFSAQLDNVIAWQSPPPPYQPPYQLPQPVKQVIEWIPVELRLPTAEDADESDCVLVRFNKCVRLVVWDSAGGSNSATHWASLKGATP